MMPNQDVLQALDLMTGRWRTQILHAGVKLGILDTIENEPIHADQVAKTLGLDPINTYRLLRALGTIGVLREGINHSFEITSIGSLFATNHPNSLRSSCLWEEGSTMYRAWTHLPEIVKEGGDDGIIREFGKPAFDLIATNPDIGRLFNEAMTSYSSRETGEVLDALSSFDSSGISTICDIGGGFGHLLCSILQDLPQASGIILEIAATLQDKKLLLADQFGVANRVNYHAGDMFKQVPKADAYILKHILHDWDDKACQTILDNARSASSVGAQVLIAEYVVPKPETKDFSKIFDIHMMSVLTGRERTENEFIELLSSSGWTFKKTWYQNNSSMAVVEGIHT